MSYVEKEKLIKADIASIENRVRHAFNQGYDLGYKEGKERAKAQEPTTKNDLGVDCISRADAIRVASGYCHPSNVAKELAKLPSVTPIRPKGHWTEEFSDLEGEVRFTCSSCGEYQLFGTDFCYHCGSDNREVEK